MTFVTITLFENGVVIMKPQARMIPRIGDTIDAGYYPMPKVVTVVLEPKETIIRELYETGEETQKRIEQFSKMVGGVENIDAIIFAE